MPATPRSLQAAQRALAPRLDKLPGHWVRLDGRGQVLAADPALLARLGSDHPGCGGSFIAWLAPASQALWSTSLWPTLTALHSLGEALIDLVVRPPVAAAPGSSADDLSWPVLSSWRVEEGTEEGVKEGANEGPDARCYLGLLTPGLERRRLLAELRRSLDSLESMPGAVLQVAPQPGGGVAFPYASSQLLDLLGVTPTQAQAQPERLLAALTPASRQALLAALAQALVDQADHWLVVLTPLHRPQRRLQLSARRPGRPLLWHGVLTDVSEREALQQELRLRAETDALTHLPNRSALMNQLGQRLRSGQPLALLFMDCDRFKQINDSLGHDAGDEVLRHLAQRLRHGLRPADALLSVGAPETAASAASGPASAAAAEANPLAARLGGDEFVIIAEGVTDAAGVAAIADRLVRTMAQPYRVRGLELMAPVSVGVVLAQADSAPEQMLRDADTAMYEAKRRGRGSWVLFEPEMHTRVAGALALENDLRQALQAGQLRAAFQPIIEIASGRIVGLEALARWHHPVRGEVPPGRFIPVAEDSGLIAEVGEAVLRAACTAFAGWRRAGLAVPPRLSVNLSRAQLTDRALASRLGALLAGLGLPCRALQLEVTESMAMDEAAVREVLAELRALGVQLALDDFGTGHSSLASLHSLPVQQVKIDRAFVCDIETSAYHRALVQAVLQVAQALGLEVVAEGVETVGQARLLAELGCPRAQGWLYARALEADAVPAFLSSEVPRHADTPLQGSALAASVARGHSVLVTDAQGLTEHVNAAFTLNTGYTLDDLRGRSPGSLLQGPDSDPRAKRLLRDAQLNGTGCLGVEIVNYRKDGRPFDVVIDIEPVRDASGRIVQFVSLQTEVSERKRAERELSELQLRIRDVQAVGLVGFWERNLATGVGQGDAQCWRLLGLRADAPALAFGELTRLATADTRAAVEQYFDEVRSGLDSGLVQFSVVRADGGARDLQAHWSRHGDRLLGVLVDVSGTARRQAEQLRLLRQVDLATAAADPHFRAHDQGTGQGTGRPPDEPPFVAAHHAPPPVAAALIAPIAPIAPQRAHVSSYHGQAFPDPWHWLRQKDSPPVLDYLQRENAYTAATTQALQPLVDTLYAECLGRLQQTDLGVPVRHGRWYHYTRTVQGLQYPIHARRRANAALEDDPQAPEELLLDLNALARGLAFISLGELQVSDDGRSLLYTLDDTGFRQYKLYRKDLASGQVDGPLAERVTGAQWMADHRSLVYSTEDAQTKRSDTLWRLAPGGAPERLHHEADALFRLGLARTKDRRFLLLNLQSTDTWEVRLLDAQQPDAALRTVLPRRAGHKYQVEHRDERLYLRTNLDAKDFRIVTAPLADADPARWQPLVAHRPGVLVHGLSLFQHFMVVSEKHEGLNRWRIHDFRDASWRELPFTEPVYTAAAGDTPEFTSTQFRYTYQSFLTPPSVLDLDMASGATRLLKQQAVLGGYDASLYVSERLWATARDGTRVPLSIVSRRDRPRAAQGQPGEPGEPKKEGPAPLWLYGYGAYGHGLSASFAPWRLSLLDRGLAFAIAHVRGGNELGEAWHDEGMLMKKKNSFFDFIDCAEHLVQTGWTTPAGLLAEGGSAGGLLMGAVVNLRPDLFRAVHAAVPFLDVVHTTMDPSLPLVVGEYLEWGDPNERAAFDYIHSYSPYDQLRAQAYPALLLTSSYNDSQVMYWEPAKYVARLRTLKTDDRPLLLKMKMEPAGHGGASGRYDALRDRAFELAWMLQQVGITA